MCYKWLEFLADNFLCKNQWSDPDLTNNSDSQCGANYGYHQDLQNSDKVYWQEMAAYYVNPFVTLMCQAVTG